jgi:DNA-binding beta-propeller fold protein YncE
LTEYAARLTCALAIRLRLCLFALLPMALASPAAALAAPHGQRHATRFGTIAQLRGKQGCLVDRSRPAGRCGRARGLQGAGPFMGSRAIAVSPDGRNVYVAGSTSDAIAVLERNRRTGALSQERGSAGCVAAKGAHGCAPAVGLEGPNSIAVSPDGKNVYATSRGGNSITSFRRNRRTGALRQLPPSSSGCISTLPIPGCTGGRALLGADVVVVSPDGSSVYAGSFFGNAVAAFSRNRESGGALTQAPGAGGCIAESGAEGCAPGVALGAVEGLAVSRDGSSVYAASALSGALAVLLRDPESGALSQAGDGSGCITDSFLSGCATGVELAGANAVATSPGNDVVYLTSLLSNSVTVFQPATASAGMKQKEGTPGCVVWLRSVGCGFGRALSAPEGLAVSPDGASLYATAFRTGALDVFDRNRETGTVSQKPGKAGCLARKSVPGCTRARALAGVSSVALSPDSRFVYTTSFFSDAVDVFRRNR